jgi:hypothetical protein
MTKKKEKTKERYDKPVSLYPLKPEEAMAAFMKVKPEKIKNRKKHKGIHENIY